MTMGERIKKVRRSLDLTQREFGERISIKQNSVAQIEMGRNTSDQTISAICKTFNVSETWLRTGEGDPFNPTPETVIDELVKEYHLDNVDREIIKQFIDLKPEERKIIKEYIQRVAQHIEATDKTLEQEADEFAAMAREQFISEKKQASQALSAKESDVG